MHDRHSPDPIFVNRLETRVVAEAQRLRLAPARASWWVRSRLGLGIAAATIAIVSMGVGAAGVAAAYQAQSNAQRDLLAADLQRRIELARQRLQLASQELQRAQTQVDIGTAVPRAVLEARQKVGESQIQLQLLESRLAEVRITGREALDDLTAPRVESRDFVGDRLRISLTEAQAALQAGQTDLHEAEVRFSVGIADNMEVRLAAARVADAQATVGILRSKLAIRQKFLEGATDPTQVSLQVIEAEAEQRHAALLPKLQIAEQQVQRAESMLARGVASAVDVAQAKLNLEQVQTDIAKADLDLALARRQMRGGRRGGGS